MMLGTTNIKNVCVSLIGLLSSDIQMLLYFFSSFIEPCYLFVFL